jgi:hypothetical protein
MPLHALPLTKDPQYLAECWKAAREKGFEAVHFSHNLCHDAHDLLDDPAWAAEARSWVAAISDCGIETWVWTHEFHLPPPHLIGQDDRFLFDEGDWAGHLREKYRKFLTETLPGITGLVFTFAETSYEIYKDDRVVSRHSAAERLRQLMQVLVEIGQEHGTRIVVRDFVYRLNEVDSMAHAIQGLPSEVAVMSKAVPHDWQPFYPPNPIIGQCGEREQWMEFDLGLEYEGQQMLPYANLEQTAAWYRHGRAKGIRHICLRLDRFDGEKGQSALSTPWGQLALSAFVAWEEDAATTVESIYEKWEEGHFPGAARAVQLATTSLQKMLFPMKNWLANHCLLPTYEYATSHLVDGNADRLETWTGEATYAHIRENFIHMPRAFRLSLEEEAEDALRAYEEASEIVRTQLDPAHPATACWNDGYMMLGSYLRLFAAYRRALFLLREHEENPASAEPVATVREAIEALADTAKTEAPLWRDRFFTGALFHRASKGEAQGPFLEPIIQTLRRRLDGKS